MNCRKCSRELPSDAIYCCYCGVKQVAERSVRTKGNGLGSVYKRPDRGTWCAAVTVNSHTADGKVVQKRKVKSGFKTKKAANEYLSAIISGKEVLHTKSVPTVADLYRQFVDSPGKKPGASTMSAYRTAFNKRLMPSCGELEIDVVTLKHLEDAIRGLNYDPAKDVKDLASLLFKRAIADGFVQVNPATLLALPEKKSVEIPAWLPSEIEALWHAYREGNRIAAACLLMVYTGMMPGELFLLKQDMVNYDSRTITGCGLKTKERRERAIVLSESIVPVLQDLCETSPSRVGYVLGMSRDKFYDLFGQMKKDLNIRQEVRPYSSRHSTATELELLGVSPSVIAQVLRHKNYATTAKHYIDISSDAALAAVDRIGAK